MSKLRTLKPLSALATRPLLAKQGPLEVTIRMEEWRGLAPTSQEHQQSSRTNTFTPTKALPLAAAESTLSFSNTHRTSHSRPSGTWHHPLPQRPGFSPFFLLLVFPALRAKAASFSCYYFGYHSVSYLLFHIFNFLLTLLRKNLAREVKDL